jgi:GAG-pre-integrase domain
MEAIGHGVSEPMRVVNFLNSLSEVSALPAVLSALRVIDNLSWTKATTQILLESELKGVNNNMTERPERAMVANNGFTGTCYTCLEVGHRSSDHIDRGRHQSRHPMRRYVGHGGGHHADSRQQDHHVDNRQGHGGARPGGVRQEGARQGGAGHEGDFHGRERQGGDQYRVRFSNDGNDGWRHARAAPAIGYHHLDQFIHTNSSSDDDQFDRAASAIVAAHHVGNKLHSQTVVVDSSATRHMFYDLSVFHKLEPIAPTTVKLGDESTANCTQIGEVMLHMSDGRRLRLSQVIYVPRLAINLLSVSQLAKRGIMTSLTKTGCALIDSDDGNCLLVEASITPGGLYVITKAVRRASLADRSLSATAASSSSKSLAPLSKDMQMLWHARLGHVGFETVTRTANTGATTRIDSNAHTKNCNCHTCLLQKASRRTFKGSLVKRASVIGDVIHTDLAGTMPPTISGYKYV